MFNFSSNDHGFGDVNISAILNSFQMGYDKRVRPNYGGEWRGAARCGKYWHNQIYSWWGGSDSMPEVTHRPPAHNKKFKNVVSR